MPDAPTHPSGPRAAAKPSAPPPPAVDAPPPPRTGQQVLDAYYFEMRWRCLSLAADLDRVERAAGGPAVLSADPRVAKLREAIGVLLSGTDAGRAERVQMIFSDKTAGPK